MNPKETVQNSPQEVQALFTLNELLSHANARELRDNMDQLFYGFLFSQKADNLEVRKIMTSTHSYMVTFLTKIANLPKIDRYDR